MTEAQARERNDRFAKLSAKANVVCPPFPVQHFVKTGTTARVDVTQDVQYTVIRDLVHRTCRICRIGLQSETIRARFHPRNSLEKQDFIDFIKTTPLSIIFTELPSPAGDGRITWGKVIEGQDQNEIFVNIKLVDALRQGAPAHLHLTVQQEQDQTEFLRLLFMFTLFQESIHTFTKHFWGSDFENRAGWGFEEAYLDFVLEAFCRREFADDPDKLWRIERLVARTEKRKELSTEDIHRIVASVGKNTIWQVELDALPPLPSHITNDTYYRVRASDEGDMVEEEEEEPIDHSVWVVYDLRCRGR